jgi:succinoglycan biosynthesis protein ExoA
LGDFPIHHGLIFAVCPVTNQFNMRHSWPYVSVVVPCRNERGHIESCLTSILGQIEPLGGMEIVIADGMSDDGTREIVKRFAACDSRVRLIDNPECITPTGLNAAIRAARGEIIIRMDAHSEYAPDYVSRCVEVLQSTGADNVGGPARIKATGYVQRAVGAAFQSRFSTGGARFHLPEYEGEVDTVHYGCWLTPTLLEIGLFDVELIRNQDDELNYRIRSRGGRLWQSPDIRSWYSPRSSLAALFSQYFQYGYWKVRVIQKHARSVALRHIVPVLFVLTLLVGWLPGVLYSPLLVIYAGIAIAYLMVSIAVSVPAARNTGWDLLPILPVVFAVFHVSYGLGFATGVFAFGIRQRQGSGRLIKRRRDAHERNRAA